MTELAFQVVKILQGKTISAAESCTGGMLGAALTGVPGSSAVYVGGIISYTNEIKHRLLGVSAQMLDRKGAVSAPVAEAMASGVRNALKSDIAVSVTGLAGPGGDEYGNPVGTVFIGYCDERLCLSREYHFTGDRESVRRQSVEAALSLLLEHNR